MADFRDNVMRLAALIERHQRFVLTGHVNIDGDSLGSMLAMLHHLRRCGKEVTGFCFEPLLERYHFLGGEELLEIFDSRRHRATVAAAECFMMFDFSAPSRSPGLFELAAQSKAIKVCVDHHPGEELPGDVNLHDEKAPSTGTLVLEFLRAVKAPLDRRIAEALLVAIGTDTGWFRYHNTSAAVLRDVAELVDHGVDLEKVYRSVYQRNDTALIQLFGRVAAAATEECDGRLLSGRIPLEAALELGVGPYETDELLDLLRTSGRAVLIALFREVEGNEVRINLRSRGDIDVGQIAKSLGGGGHVYAAGATVQGPLDAAAERTLAKLRSALAPAAAPRR
jgi:phosphoesterase RecJ-like protein